MEDDEEKGAEEGTGAGDDEGGVDEGHKEGEDEEAKATGDAAEEAQHSGRPFTFHPLHARNARKGKGGGRRASQWQSSMVGTPTPHTHTSTPSLPPTHAPSLPPTHAPTPHTHTNTPSHPPTHPPTDPLTLPPPPLLATAERDPTLL